VGGQVLRNHRARVNINFSVPRIRHRPRPFATATVG